MRLLALILASAVAVAFASPAMALGKAGGKDQRIEKRLVKLETRKQKLSGKTGKIGQFRTGRISKREVRLAGKLSPQAQQQVASYASNHGWGGGPHIGIGVGWGNGWGNGGWGGWGGWHHPRPHGPFGPHGPQHNPWFRARR